MFEPWHNFFLLMGAAAATLLGLVFVAASIATTIPSERLGDSNKRTILVDHIVYAFVRILVVCAVGVFPGLTLRSFGYAVCILAALNIVRTVRSTLDLLRTHRVRQPLSLAEWGSHLGQPLAATFTLTCVGIALAVGCAIPMQFIAIGLVTYMVVGIHSAWKLTDWLAAQR